MFAAALMTVPAILFGQEKSPAQSVPPANPITTSEKTLYCVCERSGRPCSGENAGRQLLLQTSRRRFAVLVSSSAHQADEAYFFCSQALGEANPKQGIEENDHLENGSGGGAQGRSCVLQPGAFGGMTDAKGSEVVKFFNFDMARLTLLLAKIRLTRMSTTETW